MQESKAQLAKAAERFSDGSVSDFFAAIPICRPEISQRARQSDRRVIPPVCRSTPPCVRVLWWKAIHETHLSSNSGRAESTTVIALNDHLMNERRGSQCMPVLIWCELASGVQCCVDVEMEEVRISDWPEPPGSHAWLPAYGFQHDLLDKDDYFGTNGKCGQRIL